MKKDKRGGVRPKAARSLSNRPERAVKASALRSHTGPLSTKARLPVQDSAGIIEEVALDLFAQRSYSAVTIKDISAATGLNAGLIYYYFENKEELFRATVELAVSRALEQFKAIRETASSPEEIISGWLETHVREIYLIRKFVKIIIDYASTGTRSSRIDSSIEGFYRSERKVLIAAVNEGIESGVFQPVEPEQIAVFISTFLDGAMVRSIVFPDFDPVSAIRDLRDLVVSHLQFEAKKKRPRARWPHP
jgi:TetR/AcrR family transcriptional regulator, upper aerobic nicotinate degradation pathway regulator